MKYESQSGRMVVSPQINYKTNLDAENADFADSKEQESALSA